MRPASRAGKRILIVEDEAIIARDLSRTLEDLGYVVVGISVSSNDAIRVAAECQPDLILMDIRIPDGPDGIETAKQIQERQPVPVVYLSANTDPQTLQRALTTAPGGYLAKPFDSRTLRTTIEVALGRHEAEIALRHAHAATLGKTVALEREVRELSELTTRLRHDGLVDPLTGLFNRRHFEAELKRKLTFARRKGSTVGLLMLDVDHFKEINDTFGHLVGDAVLRDLARFLGTQLRPYDIACRYGGEEFVILAPGASLSDSQRLADRLRQGIAGLVFFGDGLPLPPITASFGVAAFPDQGEVELLRAADAALYRAKDGGRNRVATAP